MYGLKYDTFRKIMSSLKNKKMSQLSPEDFLDDRLQSEIRNESLKEGSLKIIDTNYYVDGILRKYIKVKGGAGDEDIVPALTQPEGLDSSEDADSGGDEGSSLPALTLIER